MNRTGTWTIAMLLTASVALGTTGEAATTLDPAPATPTASGEDDDFGLLMKSCCSECREAAESLCPGGKVTNFDCGGFPCECSFDCAQQQLTLKDLGVE